MAKTKQDYDNEKMKYAFGLYKEGKSFQKARAIVVKGDKLIVLRNNQQNIKASKCDYFFAGGGVDDGETLEEAVEREVMEELGVKCKAREEIYCESYQPTLSYNGVNFISKREAHFFICDFISDLNRDKIGIEGEFDDEIKVEEIDLSQIDQVNICQELRDKIINILT